MNVGIIGAGAWGSALAKTIKKAENNVVLWSKFDEKPPYWDDKITTNIGDVKNTDVWLFATPSEFARETLTSVAPYYNNQPIIICTKGIESETNKFMSELTSEIIPNATIAILAGPQFAEELADGVPTGSTLACDKNIFDIGIKIFGNHIYLEHSDDIIGAQLCGVGKNAIALICGYYSIKGGGENERAMKLTLAWEQVIEYGLKIGANPMTFNKLCGVGDLFLSATSRTSRNYSAGVAIARGEEIKGTIEGINAIKGLVVRGRAVGLAMQIFKDFT